MAKLLVGLKLTVIEPKTSLEPASDVMHLEAVFHVK